MLVFNSKLPCVKQPPAFKGHFHSVDWLLKTGLTVVKLYLTSLTSSYIIVIWKKNEKDNINIKAGHCDVKQSLRFYNFLGICSNATQGNETVDQMSIL